MTGKKSAYKGQFLSRIKTYVSRQRLGELLVLKGLISPQNLKSALHTQKEKNLPLGQVLVEAGSISRSQLAFTLFKQQVLRYGAGVVLVIASMGIGQRANADIIQDIPAKVSLTSAANNAFAPLKAHPAVFETEERKSNNLRAFTKWTDMFNRFDNELQAGTGYQELQLWRAELSQYRDNSIKVMAERVNDLVNKTAYVVDQKVWGKSDYWATPVEFLVRGAGDCEDFAIAKYIALRALGVPEDRLRVAIVHDNIKNIPHAVLIVYSESGPVILDNQTKSLIDGDRAGRYRPIYSINRTAWWLHTAPEPTVVASAY